MKSCIYIAPVSMHIAYRTIEDNLHDVCGCTAKPAEEPNLIGCRHCALSGSSYCPLARDSFRSVIDAPAIIDADLKYRLLVELSSLSSIEERYIILLANLQGSYA